MVLMQPIIKSANQKEMCGRFTANVKKKELEEEWNLAVPSDFRPRYNIAPSQLHPIIYGENNPEFEMFQWGLIAKWISMGGSERPPFETGISAPPDTQNRKPLVNTRIESLIKGKMQLHTPCLIPATSWFEWLPYKERRPFALLPTDRKLFAFAGICHSRKLADDTFLKTFSIVTTKAADSIAKIHHRMPLVLNKELEAEWLNLKQGRDLNNFIENAEKTAYKYYPISRLVNKVSNDTEEVIKEFRETLF